MNALTRADPSTGPSAGAINHDYDFKANTVGVVARDGASDR